MLVQPRGEIAHILAHFRRPCDERISPLDDPRIQQFRLSHARDRIPDADGDQPRLALPAQQHPSPEERFSIQSGKKQVVAQADQQFVTRRVFVGGHLVCCKNQLFHFRQPLPQRHFAVVIQTEIDILASRLRPHVDTEPPSLVLKPERKEPLHKRVTPRQPSLRPGGGRRRRQLPRRHHGVSGRNRAQLQLRIANKHIAPLANPFVRRVPRAVRVAH